MNLKNMQRLARLGVKVNLVPSANGRGRGHVEIIDSTGQFFGIAMPPHLFDSDRFSAATATSTDPNARMFEEHDPACEAAAQAMAAYSQYAHAAQRSLADKFLSPEGLTAAIKAAAQRALTVIDARYRLIADASRNLASMEAEILKVPEPAAGQQVVDVEARGLFRSLSPQEQLTVLTNVGKPEYQATLLALKRSPLPLPLEENGAKLLDQAWRDHVSQQKPAQFKALTVGKENADWALSATHIFAGAVAYPRSKALMPATLSRLEAWQAVRENGPNGSEALGITEQDAANLENVLRAGAGRAAA